MKNYFENLTADDFETAIKVLDAFKADYEAKRPEAIPSGELVVAALDDLIESIEYVRGIIDTRVHGTVYDQMQAGIEGLFKDLDEMAEK